jgi:hypothetical protein
MECPIGQNMKKTKIPPTYEGEALAVLAYEFDVAEQAESDRKIKRRLRDKHLGPYDQGRIDALRKFKNDVREELGKSTESKFWIGAHKPFRDMRDWDFDALLSHMQERHPGMPKDAIDSFLPYAIYLYYLR